MEKPTKPFYTRLTSLFRKNNSRVSYSALLGVVVGLVVTIMAIDIYAKNHTNYIVKVDNSVIGYVDNIEEFKSAVKSITNSDGSGAAEHLTYEKTREAVTKFVSGYDIEKSARQKLNLKIEAVAVSVGGEQIAVLKNHEDVNKLLDEVKKYYVSQIKGDTVRLISSSIKESIETKSVLVETREVLDINDAVQKIANGKGEKQKYKIKQGDTIWDIALENGVTTDEIQEANPDTNLDRIQIDQEINLAVTVPYLNVEIVAQVVEHETIPYDTKTLNDKSIAKGVTKIKQSGKTGKSEIKKTVTVVNGIIVKEDVQNTKVLTAAVDKIVVSGTKAPKYSYAPTYVASVGSGRFSWPSRGAITSRFGRRWGRQHTGLDIDGSTGDPIHAADGGTVSFAGYQGSYGNLVIINHGNGFQTYYAHQSKILVRVGQKVSKGELIGRIGNTGRSTGSHLHFEVRKNGVPQNPLLYLK